MGYARNIMSKDGEEVNRKRGRSSWYNIVIV